MTGCTLLCCLCRGALAFPAADRQHIGGPAKSAQCVLHAGVQELLHDLHEWPNGLSKDSQWITEAAELVNDTMRKHARDASDQAMQPERHMRSVMAVTG